MPQAWFTPTIAPTGAVFCQGCGLVGAEGNLFFGSYKTGYIREVRLTADRKNVSSLFVAYRNEGSILSMERSPEGGIYFSTPEAIYELIQA